jgi:hypothetical protein
LTLSGNTGNVVRWESAVAPFTSWTAITNTASTYTSGALSQTTAFRAVVRSGVCAAANADSTIVTVSPTTVKGAVSGGAAICAGANSGLLTLSGNTGNVVRWESAVAPFSSWTAITNTASTYTSGALSQTTAFRAVVQSGVCGIANADSTVVTVSPATVRGTVSGNTPVCTGTSSNLTLASNTGNVVRWESAIAPFTSWTTIANTTTALTTGSLTQATAFRAVVQSGVCAALNTDSFVINTIASGVWLGSVSTNWNNAANWCGGIPTAASNVVINSGTAFAPIINTAAIVNNITLGTGATLAFSGTVNSIDIRGNITENGSFNKTNGTVIFGGNATQTIPAGNYNGLSVTGGANKLLAGSVNVTGTLTLTNGYLLLDTAQLSITASGSIAGGSASSFVVTNGSGRLTQSNIGSAGRSGNILFPVGNATNAFTPATINNAGTADNFSVRVINGAYPAYTGETPSGTAYASDVVNKTWFISEANVGGSVASITFQWNAADELSMARANMLAARYNTAWQTVGTGAAIGTGPYSFVVNGVTALGTFGLGDSSSSLPVTLVDFKGNQSGKDVLLTWSTVQEINNSHFELERSFDAVTFEKVAKVDGNGNSVTLQQYAYNDLRVMANNNTVYYRLKQVDFDGTANYSHVIVVTNKNNDQFNVISAAPNPFSDKFHIDFVVTNSQVVNIEIMDAFGKLINQTNAYPHLGNNSVELNGELLGAGVYFVRLSQNGDSKIIRMVKHH